MLLTENNIKSELSYAYLHAVASRAGFACGCGNRHEDGIGIDAELRVKESFGKDSRLLQFAVDVQLKSTCATPTEVRECYSYPLPMKNYNELRSVECGAPQLLIVLYLPGDDRQWLEHSVEQLIVRRCAYWVSLRGAEVSENATSQTVYIPKQNGLSVDSLRDLMARFSRRETIEYDS